MQAGKITIREIIDEHHARATVETGTIPVGDTAELKSSDFEALAHLDRPRQAPEGGLQDVLVHRTACPARPCSAIK